MAQVRLVVDNSEQYLALGKGDVSIWMTQQYRLVTTWQSEVCRSVGL